MRCTADERRTRRAPGARWPAALLTIALSFAIVACSGSSKDGDETGGDTTADVAADGGTISDVVLIPDDAGADAAERDAFVKPDVRRDVGRDLGPCPPKTPCNDNDPCTMRDECGDDGLCRGIPYECDDGLSCTRNACIGDGECEYPLRSGHCYIDGVCFREGEPNPDNPCLECTTPVATDAWTPDDRNGCDDGDACTSGDRCVDGVCAGEALACDDGNPCTDDACDPVLGECVNAANAVACDDRDPCTVGDTCAEGACVAGAEPLSCEDDNPCTIDECRAGVGCRHETVGAGACDDGDACTRDDHCEAGACVGSPVLCVGGNPCIDYVCDPEQGCVEIPNSEPCDDMNPCTLGDFCANGRCRAGEENACDDSNPCTADLCMPTVVCNAEGVCLPAGGCTYAPAAGPCEDADPCTIGDYCANGVCVGGSGEPDCTDNNACTEEHCEPGEGCVYEPIERDCDDGNPCTVGDHCEEGVCTGGLDEALCDDGNPCTDNLCDALTGCRFPANSEPCDDGNPCTVGDYCQFTRCRPGRDPMPCDDGDPCTDDSCLPLFGCDHTHNTEPCDDGDPCTLGDTCDAGTCYSGTEALVCDDENPCTDDACVPGEGCVFTPNTSGCDDNDPCTTVDSCVDGVCVGDGWLECPDLNPCTNEFCESGVGCTATVVNDFDCRPQIVITYPERGAQLVPPRDVEIQGYVVAPAGPIEILTINDFRVELDEENNFAFTPPPADHGTNVIVAYARDVWGAEDRVVQAYQMSTGYQPIDVADPTSSMVPKSIQAFLGSTVFDDGDNTPDDIAAMIRQIAISLDINSMIPNPVTSGEALLCDYDISLRNVFFGAPEVDMWPTWDGLFVRLDMSHLQATVDVDWCFGADGRVRADDLMIQLYLNVLIDEDGFAQVETEEVIVYVGSVDVDIDGALGFLFDWLINFFEDDLARIIEEQVAAQLTGPIQEAIEGVLNGVMLNQALEVPALLPGMEPTEITVMSRLDDIEFWSHRAVILSMKTTVVAPKGTPYEPQGSLLWDNCLQGEPQDLDFDSTHELQMALHDDLLNQVFYAAYWAGLLEVSVDVEAMLGEGGLDDVVPGGLSDLVLDVSAMLPPVITSCNAWDDILIQMGDVGIHGTFNMMGMDVELDLFASLELSADVRLVDTQEGNQITIVVRGVNFIEIEVARLNDALLGNEGVISDLLEGMLIPMVLESVEGMSFGFTLPNFNIAELAPGFGLPPDLVLTLDVQDFRRHYGYTVMAGELR